MSLIRQVVAAGSSRGPNSAGSVPVTLGWGGKGSDWEDRTALLA